MLKRLIENLKKIKVKMVLRYRDSVPTFAYADDNIKVFEFPKYYVFIVKRNPDDDIDEPLLIVKAKRPMPIGKHVPTEIKNQFPESLKKMGAYYYDEDRDRIIVHDYLCWLPVSLKLEQAVLKPNDYFSGYDFSESGGICLDNFAEKLYEGVGSDYMQSPQSQLIEELMNIHYENYPPLPTGL